MCLGDVVQFVLAAAQAAGGHGVQQRLPDMGAAAVHERNFRATLLAEHVTEAGGELKAGRTTADDDDVVWGGRMLGRVGHRYSAERRRRHESGRQQR